MALRLVVAALVLVAGTAGTTHADGDDDAREAERQRAWAEKRAEAEAIEKAALASGDMSKYVACGEAYLELYNGDRENKHNDEVLYNAGVCFADAKSIGSSIQSFGLLRRYYPNSKLAMKALARSAMMYADTAYFDRAAAQFEEYAVKYAGEKDAKIALAEAVYYYRALGSPKWIELTRVFIKMFGAKRPDEAAMAYFGLTSAYDADPEAQQKHLREYLRIYGSRDPDRVVLAYAKLGELLWAKSCPVKMTNGLCVKQVRVKPSAPKRCGKNVVVDDVLVARDERLVKEAMQAYAAVLKARGSKASPEATHATAMAHVTTADRELEAMVALGLPKGLELGALNGKKRFAEWEEMQKKAGAAAVARYQEVIALRDPTAALAAMQRIAMTSEVVWKQLDAAELPKGQGEAYCTALREVAEPLRLRAQEAYGACAAKAAELQLYPPVAEVCLQALERFDPALYPAMQERVAPALAVGTVLAVEPPITRAPW